ncbi:MAG: hypothetical protein ACR2H1_10215, partial [Limisphaerales bacterium]
YWELSRDIEVFGFRGREYRFAGQCPFYHHLTDAENRLLGFVLKGAKDITEAPGWFEWIKAGENKFFDESYDIYFYLKWPQPIQWDHDGSTMIGANVYHDGQGDFLITIDDNKATGKDGQFQNLWSSIAFPLASAQEFQVLKYFSPTKSA